MNIKKIILLILVITIITEKAFCYNGQQSTEFSGPYSSAMDNLNLLASDAAIAGFIGSSGRGVCPAGNNDEQPLGEIIYNYTNPVFKNWASEYVNYIPAPAYDTELIGSEIYSPHGGVPSQWRKPLEALGEVTGDNFNVCVLGDLWESQLVVLTEGNQNYASNQALAFNDPYKIQAGSLTVSFDEPITNGPGPDIAIFENGFISAGGAGVGGQIFAELAFVEVSSNGSDFVRFPCVSLTEGNVGSYGTIDPSNIFNLAGKHVNAYQSSWGTPFNLKDLENHQEVVNGAVNLNNINYVRIVDVPGNGFFQDNASELIDPNSINSETGLEGVYYQQNNGIHDAWVTWGSGGADIEAIGVVEQIYGDANSDGRVDMNDFARLAIRWGKYGNWPQGDFDENNIINTNDLILMAEYWLYDVLNN